MSGVGLGVGFDVGWPAWSVHSAPEVKRPAAQIATTKLPTSAVHSGGMA
jgi:hypothetical protein